LVGGRFIWYLHSYPLLFIIHSYRWSCFLSWDEMHQMLMRS